MTQPPFLARTGDREHPEDAAIIALLRNLPSPPQPRGLAARIAADVPLEPQAGVTRARAPASGRAGWRGNWPALAALLAPAACAIAIVVSLAGEAPPPPPLTPGGAPKPAVAVTSAITPVAMPETALRDLSSPGAPRTGADKQVNRRAASSPARLHGASVASAPADASRDAALQADLALAQKPKQPSLPQTSGETYGPPAPEDEYGMSISPD